MSDHSKTLKKLKELEEFEKELRKKMLAKSEENEKEVKKGFGKWENRSDYNRSETMSDDEYREEMAREERQDCGKLVNQVIGTLHPITDIEHHVYSTIINGMYTLPQACNKIYSCCEKRVGILVALDAYKKSVQGKCDREDYFPKRRKLEDMLYNFGKYGCDCGKH